MRIIDKNHDFYDYLQDPTDNTLVFDRRNSFMLEKDYICDAIYKLGDYKHDNSVLLKLQCGVTYWVFLIIITDYDHLYKEKPINYQMELIATWTDREASNKLLDLNLYNNSFTKRSYINGKDVYKIDRSRIVLGSVQYYTSQNSCYDKKSLGPYETYIEIKGKLQKKTYTYPLLYSTDIANLINPLDMFCAIEEYFSIEKTRAEKTEPVGATNDDKIIMHGFDTKISFRGKNK